MPYFRCWPRDEAPARLTRPSEQYSTPWGAPERGPCDKCATTGLTVWRCRSCASQGPARDCPSCAGRISFRAHCPACGGTGTITRTTRDGVSVFPTLAGLYSYLAERDADLSGECIVALEGPLSGDEDLDADAGALLIKPTRVVSIHQLDQRRLDEAGNYRRTEEAKHSPSPMKGAEGGRD